MKAKLIKQRFDFYGLKVDGKIIATNDVEVNKMLNYPHVISLKNCQEIENGYDFDEYREGVFYAGQFGHPSPEGFSDEQVGRLHGFIDGFQKALEILGDKKYTEDNVMQMAGYMFRVHRIPNIDGKEEAKKYLQELQQTEWDVEIETTFLEEEKTGLEELSWGRLVPRLDADGCLILKRIEL